jgi:hypothetical protein
MLLVTKLHAKYTHYEYNNICTHINISVTNKQIVEINTWSNSKHAQLGFKIKTKQDTAYFMK